MKTSVSFYYKKSIFLSTLVPCFYFEVLLDRGASSFQITGKYLGDTSQPKCFCWVKIYQIELFVLHEGFECYVRLTNSYKANDKLGHVKKFIIETYVSKTVHSIFLKLTYYV